MTKFLSPLKPFITGVHRYSYRYGKGFSKLFSANYSDALKGEHPDLFIDYSRVQLTKGSLPGICKPQVSSNKQTFLDFHWKNNSNENNGGQLDRLYLAFYNEDRKRWEIAINVALREDEFVTMDMSNHQGNSLHIYAGFISPDKRRISNSQYLGMIKI